MLEVTILGRDGHDWGPPADDDTATEELERPRCEGAAFLVVVWPSFWRLEHYSRRANHVPTHFGLKLVKPIRKRRLS
jgi:hypothetical protein